MAGCATGLRFNRELFFKLLTKIEGGFYTVFRFGVFGDISIAVMEIENFFQRTEVFLWSAVTF